MSKKSFKTAPKPDEKQTAEAIDRFVSSGPGKDDVSVNAETQKTANDEPTKRLTVDMPRSLHLRFKSLCAQHDMKMNDEIRQFIEQRCEELGKHNA